MSSRAYRVAPEEPVPDEVRRIARGRIDHAIDELRGRTDSTPVEAVHEARKDMKKIRALLRLARGELGRQTYDRENACFRDAARELAGQREADVMRETLDRSCLGALRTGDPVNLERPVRLDGRLGGHLVQGHVDGTGRIESRDPSEHWEVVRVSLPADLARYVVHKGSITVDGVSLTVASVDDTSFTVSLIPTTLELTTLGRKQVGDPVNLEVDVVAKYVERLMPPTAVPVAVPTTPKDPA